MIYRSIFLGTDKQRLFCCCLKKSRLYFFTFRLVKFIASTWNAGGGDVRALKCQGSSTSGAAKDIQALYQKISQCKANIIESCQSNMPPYDKTAATKCLADMTSYESSVLACAEKSCDCWEDSGLQSAEAKIKQCDLSQTSTSVGKFKDSCTAAFSACRKLEDTAAKLVKVCTASVAESQSKLSGAQARANTCSWLSPTLQ